MVSYCVFFDIGANLLILTYDNFLKYVSEKYKIDGEKLSKEYSKLEVKALNLEITEEKYFEELSKLISPEKIISDETLKDMVSKCHEGPIKEMVALKEKVAKAGYAVGMFSNMGKSGFETLSEKYPEIFETFDNPEDLKIYSFQAGAPKDKDTMYSIAEEKGYVNILIDDNIAYIEKAISRGWYGIWYTEHIDSKEAMRKEENTKESIYEDTIKKLEKTNHFIKAESAEKVEEALKTFGLSF